MLTSLDLEWKITYVGSAEDESRDQVLEEVLVGPVPVGTNKFVFQSDPPNPDLIPDEDKVGVTVALVTCSYRGREFVRVGYYVNNDYADPFLLENPPAHVDISKLQRNILADKPRVTRFPIDWSPAGAQDPNAMEVDATREDARAKGLCFKCKKPGHRFFECPEKKPYATRKVDVREMTKEERMELMEQLQGFTEGQE